MKVYLRTLTTRIYEINDNDAEEIRAIADEQQVSLEQAAITYNTTHNRTFECLSESCCNECTTVEVED